MVFLKLYFLKHSLTHYPLTSRYTPSVCMTGSLQSFPIFTPCLAVVQRCSAKKVFSCEFCEIFKNTFFYRASPLAASVFFFFFFLVLFWQVNVKMASFWSKHVNSIICIYVYIRFFVYICIYFIYCIF